MEKKNQSLLEQSFIRNLKFWGKRAEMMFLFFAVVVIFYTFLMSLGISSGGEAYTKELARQFKIYGMVMGIIIPLFSVGSFIVPGVGIALSFGAKRSETIWGSQFMLWLSSIQMFLFIVVGNWVIGGSLGWMGIYLAMLMISIGSGELMGCASIKFGVKGAVLAVIFYFIVNIAAGIWFICDGGLKILLNGQLVNLLVPAFLLAVMLCAAGSWCWKRVLSTYEVKL